MTKLYREIVSGGCYKSRWPSWVADTNNGSPIIGNGREEIATVKEFGRLSLQLSDGTLPLHIMNGRPLFTNRVTLQNNMTQRSTNQRGPVFM